MDVGQFSKRCNDSVATQGAKPSRLADYFTRRYPKRQSRTSGTVFRVGEGERIRIAREWCGPTTGLHVLDVGCGDGQYLASILVGRPASITLMDLSPHNLVAARETLGAHCDDITTLAGDFQAALPARQFDLVLCVGVLDYWPCWQSMLRQLAAVTSGSLLASLPPTGVPRHWLRRVWLALHGVRLQTVGKADLQLALCDAGLQGSLARTRFEWFAWVRGDKSGGKLVA